MKATNHELQKHDKFTRYQQRCGFDRFAADLNVWVTGALAASARLGVARSALVQGTNSDQREPVGFQAATASARASIRRVARSAFDAAGLQCRDGRSVDTKATGDTVNDGVPARCCCRRTGSAARR